MSQKRRKQEQKQKDKDLRKRIERFRNSPVAPRTHVVPAPTPEQDRHEFEDDLAQIPNDVRNMGDIIPTPLGMGKISDAILTIMEPMLMSEERPTEQYANKLGLVAMVAWNSTCVGAEERKSLIEGVLGTMPQAIHQGFIEILTFFVRRKQSLFPDDNRLVTYVRFSDVGDRLRISAGCAITPKDFPPGWSPPTK